jgi:hypothetical protein
MSDTESTPRAGQATGSLAGIGAPDVLITHHFVGGVYAKETHIPAGMKLTQHVHAFDHLSALMKGDVIVTVDGLSERHSGPALLPIRAGKAHEVTALSDVVWACIHATDETDPDKIDEALIA